ncbi:MAG: acetyl-CoA acetyltransferase [Acidimicrobiia bacterium]
MPIDPRAPVIVGVGAITQHASDPADALDAFELMAAAAERAAEDTGVRGVLGRVELVGVPRGTWSYRDPGRAVAERFGAPDPRSIIAEVGVLQQTLLTRAAEAVRDGDADVVLICGAEAKQRAVLAAKAGVELDDPDPSTRGPDELLETAGGLLGILTRTEIDRDLASPAHAYAVIESAIAHAERRSPVEQRLHAAELWSRFAAVAAANPDAWDRRGPGADEIATIGAGNRVIATPYTKLLCSQWNVDQAAAVIVVAAGTAAALGISLDRQVFAHAAAESNQMVPLPYRDEIGRWPAFEAVADALGLIDDSVAPPSVVELYSCFPAAVQVQARALGLDLDAPLTVSGGMTFGGGPLNNAVLQAMVPFVRDLREAPGERGLVTSVSGILTKPGASLWSAAPPPEGKRFRAFDVTAEATARTVVHPMEPDAVGPATVVAHTVVYDRSAPARAVALVELDGTRTIARSGDTDVVEAMTESDWIGRAVRVDSPGSFVGD